MWSRMSVVPRLTIIAPIRAPRKPFGIRRKVFGICLKVMLVCGGCGPEVAEYWVGSVRVRPIEAGYPRKACTRALFRDFEARYDCEQPTHPVDGLRQLNWLEPKPDQWAGRARFTPVGVRLNVEWVEGGLDTALYHELHHYQRYVNRREPDYEHVHESWDCVEALRKAPVTGPLLECLHVR